MSHILLLAVLLTLLLGVFIKDKRKRLLVLVVLLLAGFTLPVFGLTVAQWLRSVAGDFSFYMLLIILNIIAFRLFQYNLLDVQTRRKLLLGVAWAGIIFYPLALGVGEFDPYRLGYSPLVLATLIVLLSIYCWFTSQRKLAVVLLLPLLAYNFQLLESTNLWDYLLDPVLVIYAFTQLLLDIKFWQVFKKTALEIRSTSN